MGTRRLRDDLDRLLDRIGAGEEPEAGLAPLLHPAQAARAVLSGSVRPQIVRDHLLALRADRARNVVVLPRVRRRGVRLAAASLTAGILLVTGAGGAVAASASALPGETLYGVKRAVERVSLAMHRDPVGRAALHLQFAATRLSEIETVVAASGDPTEAVDGLEDALGGAEEEALQAVALGRDADALLAHVQQMIAKHIAVLSKVLAKVPDQAKDAIQHAIDNAEKAKAKVQQGKDKAKGKPDDAGPPASPPGKSGNAPGQGKGKPD